MACDVCDSFTYDSTIPGSPESLEAIFEYELSADYISYGGGTGKCKHCGQEIEFTYENLIHEKIHVCRIKKAEN